MGRFRPKVFGITLIAILTVVIILLVTTDDDGAVGANIPIPTLDIQTTANGNKFLVEQEEGGGIFLILEDSDVTSIACWIAQTVVLRGEDGGFIGNEKSDFLRANPFLATPIASVVDVETMRVLDLGTIATTPQIKCSTGKITVFDGGGFGALPEDAIDPEDAFDQTFPSFELPLTVEKSFFVIRIYTSLPNNTWIESYNQEYIVEKFDINSASHINLPPAVIQQEFVQNGLADGSYQTTYKIVYDGGFLMHWKEQGACDSECARIDFVIPVETVRTFQEGVLTNLSNEFEVNRQINVNVEGNNGGGTPCDEPLVTDPDTGVCVQPENDCPDDQVKSGTGASAVCIDIIDPNGDPNGGGIDVKVKEIFTKLQTCIASGDVSCLASSDFLPFWIFGIGLVVVLGAVAQRRQPDIYGVPT